MKLFLPNLAFEDELADPAFRPSPATLRAIHDLAPLMMWAGDAKDRCLLHEFPKGGNAPCKAISYAQARGLGEGTSKREIVPWGWTPQAESIVDQYSLGQCDLPDHDTVKAVNSRSFLTPFDVILEVSDGHPKSFSIACRSMSQIQDSVHSLLSAGWQKWCIKPEISHAGRNRLIGSTSDFNSQQTGWVNRQLEGFGVVFVEPWVQIEREGSLHFDVKPASFGGSIVFLGQTELLNDQAGRYQGSEIWLEDPGPADARDLRESLMTHGRNICQALIAEGYFGPVGLDYFTFRDSRGSVCLRLCNDLNARWTMGRLATVICSQLGDRRFFRWEHFVCKTSGLFDKAIQKAFVETGRPNVDILKTNPDYVGNREVRHVSVAVRGKSEAAVRAVLVAIRKQLSLERAS